MQCRYTISSITADSGPGPARKPLNIGTVSRSYHRTLGISAEDALAMAKMTRGYVRFVLPCFEDYVRENYSA